MKFSALDGNIHETLPVKYHEHMFEIDPRRSIVLNVCCQFSGQCDISGAEFIL